MRPGCSTATGACWSVAQCAAVRAYSIATPDHAVLEGLDFHGFKGNVTRTMAPKAGALTDQNWKSGAHQLVDQSGGEEGAD